MALLSHPSAVPMVCCTSPPPFALSAAPYLRQKGAGPAQVVGTQSLLCALQPPVHYLGCAGGVAAPSLQSRHSLPAVSLRVVLLLSQWGRALIQLQGASSPGGLPGMAQCPHPTQPSRPGPGGGGRWTWAGSQVDFRQNNSRRIVLQAEVLLQVPMDSAKAWSPSSTVKHCLKIPGLQLAWLSAPMPSNLCTGEQRLHPATLCNAASTSTALL